MSIVTDFLAARDAHATVYSGFVFDAANGNRVLLWQEEWPFQPDHLVMRALMVAGDGSLIAPNGGAPNPASDAPGTLLGEVAYFDTPIQILPHGGGFAVEYLANNEPGRLLVDMGATGFSDQPMIALQQLSPPADQLYNYLGATGGDDQIFGRDDSDLIIGKSGDDEIHGNDGRDEISGWAGNDRLFGNNGDDRLFGNGGNDLLSGGADHDLLRGCAGDDTIMGGTGWDNLGGQAGADRLFGYLGNDQLYGGQDNDHLQGGHGDDLLNGGLGDDQLFGSLGRDVLFGAAGHDVVSGGYGNDRLFGGDGDDVITGGHGNDAIFGGAGQNLLTGGAGADVFGFETGDSSNTITDFSDDDLIQIRNAPGLSFGDLFLDQDASTAVIQAGDLRLRLENVDAADLSADDFDFV